jgi:hypothetical protein
LFVTEAIQVFELKKVLGELLQLSIILTKSHCSTCVADNLNSHASQEATISLYFSLKIHSHI